MEGREERTIKFLFWGIILIIIILSFFILKPFLIALATAFILAYLLKPINDKMSKKMPKSVAALLSLGLVLLVLLLTIALIVGSLISQISGLLNKQLADNIVNTIKDLPYSDLIKDNLSTIVTKIGGFLISLVSASVSEIPTVVLSLFVTFFTAYYILVDWDRLEGKIKDILPYKNKHLMMVKIETVIDDILKGTFVLAVIEAVVAAIGFWILGIKFAILYGFLIGLFAFIPALGPLAVWVPLALIELSKQNIGIAIGIVILGLILMYIDAIVRIKLVGKRSRIHPAIMLVGIFGGVPIFGVMGFILGPLILSILLTIIENIPKME